MPVHVLAEVRGGLGTQTQVLVPPAHTLPTEPSPLSSSLKTAFGLSFLSFPLLPLNNNSGIFFYIVRVQSELETLREVLKIKKGGKSKLEY